MHRRAFLKVLAIAPGLAIKPERTPNSLEDRRLRDNIAKVDAMFAEYVRKNGSATVTWYAKDIKSIGGPVGTITADKIDFDPSFTATYIQVGSIEYADSSGHTPEQLAPLHDGDVTSGVEYQP